MSDTLVQEPVNENSSASAENKPATIAIKVEDAEADPSVRFRGAGTSFRAKLIGVDEVPESRGDKMCQDSILKLKAIIKTSGQHKQKIVVNITLDGIKLIDLMTASVVYQHAVDKISFISRDTTDRRAFGYVLGIGEGKHQFFGIKTAKAAEPVVLTLRDLFNVVYDIKKKEIAAAKKETGKQEYGDSPVEPVYSVPNNKPLTAPPVQEGNIFELEQQLENMQQMSEMEAFKSTPDNLPTSPDTPGSLGDINIFGAADASKPSIGQDAQYSDDLAGFDIEALEPAAGGGAKLTKDQIMAGFGQGMQQQPQASPFFSIQQQPAPFGAAPQAAASFGAAPQAAAPFGAAPQAAAPFGAAPQAAAPFGAAPQAAAPFGGAPQAAAPFGAAPQAAAAPFGAAPRAATASFGAAVQAAPFGGAPQAAAPFGAAASANPFAGGQGMFPPGPRPVVPARTGAMKPPTTTPAQTGAAQNPFGDAFGDSSSGSNSLLAPINSQPSLANGSLEKEAPAADPFASLVPSLGSGSNDKKDMFKNFQMAKPPSSSQKSSDSGSANFNDYFRKSVGGVPLDSTNAGPTPAPRSKSQDTFGLNDLNLSASSTQQTTDPLAAFGSSDPSQTQQPASMQSLFG